MATKHLTPILCALSLLSACKDDSVLATVGSAKLRKPDLDAFAGPRASTPGARDKALQELIERTLFAEGAKDRGLLNDPAVRAKVDAAWREALAQALLDKEVGPATSDEALRDLYKEKSATLARRRVHVAQIFLRLPPASDAHARLELQKTAAGLVERAKKGEPFAELAKKYSDDKISADKGGDVGPLLEGQVDPHFFEGAWPLQAGEISAPVETAFGVHILKALEAPSMSTPTFEEAKSRLAVESTAARQTKLLGQLRDSISVKVQPQPEPQLLSGPVGVKAK